MRTEMYDPAEKFNYSYDGRVMTVTGPADRGAVELRVPPEIDGHPVDVIGNGAFQYCHELRKISLPDTVRTIENAAFKGCENLEEAELSASLDSIGALAFQGCESLKYLTVSNHTDRIEINSFKECRAIEVVHVKMRDRLDVGEDRKVGGFRFGAIPCIASVPGAGPECSVYKHPKQGLFLRGPEYDVRSFAVASESDEAIWLYMRAIMRATDPHGASMDKYDATFLEIRGEDDMYRVAARRLSDPYNMSRRMYKVYRDALTGMIESIIKSDRVDRLTRVGELDCIEKEMLPEYIELAGRIGGGCTAYLLEHQNRYAKAEEYDYSL